MAQFHYQIGDEVKTVQAERVGEAFAILIGERSYTVTAQRGAAGQLVLQMADQRVATVVAQADQQLYVWLAGEGWTLPRVATARRRPSAPGHHTPTGRITAPMPGQVLELLVTAGASVAQGAPLLVLGAMKMETRLTAPRAGVIAAIGCAVGETVTRGQVLLRLEQAVDVEQSA